MKLRWFSCLLAVACIQSGLAQQTWIGSDSVSLYPQAYFNEASGILTIPNLQIFPADELGASHRATVTLHQDGGESFRVSNYFEIPTPPVCTREDILAAIAQMSLQTSYEEVDALLPCSGQINSSTSSSRPDGKLVTVSWSDQNRTAYLRSVSPGLSYSPFFVTNSSSLVFTSSGSYEPFPATNANYLSLSFFEGVLESYSYFTEGQSSIEFCDGTVLLNYVESFATGVALDSVNTDLQCNGTLVNTQVSAEGEQRTYNWCVQPLSQSNTGPYIPTPSTNVSLSGTFTDGVATAFHGEISESRPGANNCTIAQLEAAAEAIRSGDDGTMVAQTVGCDYQSRHSTFSTNGTNTTNYMWLTNLPSTSFLLSPNRSLTIYVHDGRVIYSRVNRF